MQKILTFQRNRDITFELNILDDDGDFFEIGENEKIIFAVKKNPTQEEYSIYKELTEENIENDRYLLTLTNEDTDIDAGYYYYDLLYQTADNELFAIVEYTECFVEKTVF